MHCGFWLRQAVSSKFKCGFLSPKIGITQRNFDILRSFSVSSSKNMKIVQFIRKEGCPCTTRVGYLVGDGIVDINNVDPGLPSLLVDILKNDLLETVKCLPSKNPCPTLSFKDVDLVAPITGMDKVLCIGLNYMDHCLEQNLTPPCVPMIFSKFSSTVVGPSEPVKLRTSVTQKVDWEVEMAVVIGKKASCVKSADAYNYVMGFTVAQDLSARDWQKEYNMGQFLLGKSMDSFCPIGPCIATIDEIPDPQNLNIACSLNGVQKQKSNTNQLIHSIPDVIERLTAVMTLLPGDILLTGTPGGVGMFRSPPEYLKPGDVLKSGIENIGVLETRFEAY